MKLYLATNYFNWSFMKELEYEIHYSEECKWPEHGQCESVTLTTILHNR